MKTLIKSFKIASVIIGSVLGAGFLSGKEVASFFYGGNPIIISLAIFVIFFLVIFFFLSFPKILDEKIFILVKAILLSGNVIISVGMLSAIDSIFNLQFPIFYGLPIFSVIALLLANLVAINEKEGLQKANCFLVPIIVLVFLITFLSSGDKYLVKTGKILPKNILSYCGLNLTLLLPLLTSLGEGENRKVLLLSSFLSAFLIGVGIFGIFLLTSSLNSSLLNNDLPILKMLEDNDSLYRIYQIILIFGILTSLFGSYYPVFNFFSNDFHGLVGKILSCLVIFLLSRLSFSAVVSIIYPVFGYCGFLLIVILIFSRFFVQALPLKNTLAPLTDKESRYPS